MMAIFRAMFSRLPKIGDIYEFDEGGKDPWGENPHRVRVLDVRRGWIRFEFCGDSMWKDERLSRSCFHFAYRKPNAENQALTRERQ